MGRSAAIFGLSGTVLTADERAFFQEADPAGFILFARNVENPEQVKALTSELRAISGRDRLAILIDQEGGRVARLKPPHWKEHPPMSVFGRLFAADPSRAEAALSLNCRILGAVLADLGITVDCVPCLDVPVKGADPIISDRAFSSDSAIVAALGRIACDSLTEGGALPVIKHVPGHGRANADSHLKLPVVAASPDELAANDFAPFAALSDAPLAMTAHILYPALDPDRCATLSPLIIGEVIRRRIGFEGLLMTDDLSMKALSGSLRSLAADSISAGCDLALHCNGRMDEMRLVAEGSGTLSGANEDFLEKSLASLAPLPISDMDAAYSELAALIAEN